MLLLMTKAALLLIGDHQGTARASLSPVCFVYFRTEVERRWNKAPVDPIQLLMLYSCNMLSNSLLLLSSRNPQTTLCTAKEGGAGLFAPDLYTHYGKRTPPGSPKGGLDLYIHPDIYFCAFPSESLLLSNLAVSSARTGVDEIFFLCVYSNAFLSFHSYIYIIIVYIFIHSLILYNNYFSIEFI